MSDDDQARDLGIDPFRGEGRRADDALFRSLIEQVPAVIYVDSNQLRPRTLYVSPQSLEMLGLPSEELVAERGRWAASVHPEDRGRVDDAWRTAFDRQDPFECEYRWVRPDGTVTWVRDSSVLVRDQEDRPRFRQGVVLDVSGPRRIEEALRESEARHRALVENLPAVIYQVAPDDDRRTMYVSKHVETALGYTQAEWLDQPDIWMELLHSDDREPTLAAHDRHNETGEPWSREYRLIAADGRAIWFRDVAHLVRDAAGRPLHWQGVQLDVTELKRVEDELRGARDLLETRVTERTAALAEANEMMSLEIGERRRVEQDLRAAEGRYRLLVEQIPAVTYVWEANRPDGELPQFYTSPRIMEMLGFTVEEWHADDMWIARLHPDDRRDVLAASLRSEATGEPFSMEYRYLHKDGRIVWVLDQAMLFSTDEQGRPRLFQGVMMDVSARKQAEADASESELRYRHLAEQTPAIIYVVDLQASDPEQQMLFVSPQLRGILGYGPEAWGSIERWLGTIHPEDGDRVRRLSEHSLEAGDTFEAEYRALHRDGHFVWLHDEAKVISRDALGRPKLMQGLVIDVTATRRSDEDRRIAEERYRTLVEQIPAITYTESPGGAPDETLFTYLSPQAEGIFGRPIEELLADPRHLGKLVHPDDWDRVFQANAHSEATGEPFDCEFRIVRDDGRVVWLHSTAVLVRDDGGEPLFWHGVALDVTEHRQTQALLRELETRYRELTNRVVRDIGPDPHT